MTDTYQTEQETFWAGEFGNEYSQRNRGQKTIASNIKMFTKMVERTGTMDSVMEFGANIGLNLLALRQLLPLLKLNAVEINPRAVKELRSIDDLEIHETSILNFSTKQTYDLVFTKGVLIHIAPEQLNAVYDKLYHCSKKYVFVAEYFNPTPTETPYRGHKNKLFKRDFAGELLDRFNDMQLVDYGFAYHRDPFPQDNITWFLLEKR